MQSTLKNRTLFCRDNLDVLRGIDSSTVDLIYLDPPFNKKKSFVSPIGSSAEGTEFKDYLREEDVKEEWLRLIEDHQPILHNYLQSISQVGDKSNKHYLCYMAVRLLEMHRILKDTGSIYLHCDPTMSHYLKLLLDCVFGEKNFRNEIVWCYGLGGSSKKTFSTKHDTVLFYTKSSTYTFHKPQVPATSNLLKGNMKGMPDVWSVPTINNMAKERTGYPTQKPLALLERIIQASSNEGDFVLDPFCGCATTCIAAEKLGRKWVGIDISKKTFDLVQIRLNQEVQWGHLPMLKGKVTFSQKDLSLREDIPSRTDLRASTDHTQQTSSLQSPKRKMQRLRHTI